MKTKTIFNSLTGLTLLLLTTVVATAQTKDRVYPMPGDTLADHTFTDLLNYPKTTAKISDLRGKWLILDFWGYTCSSCIASFPRMSALSQQFKDKNVQLIMVGATKSANNPTYSVDTITKWTKKLYKRQDMLHHLKFTVAFDSVLFLKLNVGSLPHILIVDPKGVIKVKTNHVDSAQLAELLDGKFPKFERKFSRDEPGGLELYDTKVPLLTNNGADANGGKDTSYIYRSMLVPQDKTLMPPYSWRDFIGHKLTIDRSKPFKIDLFDYTLERLYRLAYFGRNFWDQKLNKEVYGVDHLEVLNETGKPMVDTALKQKYSYSLTMPAPESYAVLMKFLQEDLKRVFPYQAILETRNFPAYEITIANAAKLNKFLKGAQTGKMTDIPANDGVWKVRNMDFDIFMNAIVAYAYSDAPMLNKVGIVGKYIDVDFPSDLQSRESIIEGMKKIGLQVKLIEKPMRVLVLR